MYKTNELRIRDPYVVPYNNIYYMYRADGNSIYVHKSTNREEWDDGTPVYTLSDNSWACKELWAPEVHFYKGRFYMLLSLLGKNSSNLRGTEISVCDTPDGTFIPITNKPSTPPDRSCIDGTLYVENDIPYIVYSADWPHNYNKEKACYIGEIWAMQLSEDLCRSVGEPFLLFKSDEAPCSNEPNVLQWGNEKVKRYGSDAPFIVRLSDGTLYLTWSPLPGDTYIVAAAVSKSGSIKDKWEHLDTPLFDKNGGHAMFFKAFDGNMKMCLHCPERTPDERALFLNVAEENGKLKLI